jgi:hypothetical protein
MEQRVQRNRLLVDRRIAHLSPMAVGPELMAQGGSSRGCRADVYSFRSSGRVGVTAPAVCSCHYAGGLLSAAAFAVAPGD